MATKAVLTISSKNYGAWALRGWLTARLAGLDFKEHIISPDDPAMKAEMLLLSSSMLVPSLQHNGITVWDTLAIAEYVAEKFPEKNLWPASVADRAHARSICAEMHSGFMGIRSACPMNIDAYLPEIGALAMRDKEALRNDLKRIDSMFSSLLKQHKGPMLFGEFSIPDAYFSPVVMRIKTYALPVSAETQAYIDRLCAMPGVKAWIDDALAEKDFIDFEEPFRTKP